MARIRSIKPEFWQDSKLKIQPVLVRAVFLCLWSMADDAGRLEGDAQTVWLFGSFRESSGDITAALDVLRELGRVIIYEAGGNPYIQVVNFTKHQRIDHPTPSKIPAPSKTSGGSRENSRKLHEASRKLPPDHGAGSREQGPGAGIVDQEQGPKNATVAQRAPAANGVETWQAYCSAYEARYKVEPVRNAKVNAQINQLVKRLGAGEAPVVAAFYLTHNAPAYINRGHSVGMLLIDAEKLHTEWARGRKITGLEARSAEQRDAVAEQVTRVAENMARADGR